jgi:signal transduction histidine kinase
VDRTHSRVSGVSEVITDAVFNLFHARFDFLIKSNSLARIHQRQVTMDNERIVNVKYYYSMEKTSIRKKLTTFGILMLLSAMALSIILESVMGVIIGSRRFQQAKISIEKDMLTKGMTLITNNSVALRGIVEDNAYTALREIVVTTVQQDADMSYGIYMDENRKSWVMTFRQNPDSTKGAAIELNDSLSIWADRLASPGYQKIEKGSRSSSVIEFAAPIFSDGEAGGKKLGVIRYGISMERTLKSFEIERNNSVKEAFIFIGAFLIACILILPVGLRFARRQAKNITMPIELLSKSAYEIARGNYDLPIVSNANDEIGSLADNFEQMRKTIKEYTANLEKMVAERTKELKEAQKELVEKAHQAGMADIAAGTLHNVGNILNSVKASVEAMEGILGVSPLEGLTKANKLLGDHIDRLDDFILADPRGKKLLHYYIKLEEPLKGACDQLGQNVRRVMEKINAINDVIAAQQAYAGVGGLSEKVRLADIIEDAITMQSGSLERHKIKVVRNYAEVPELFVQKTKLVHILVNIIKNAKDAMAGSEAEKRTLTLSISRDGTTLSIKVRDTGCGIAAENITRIFSHGFTTKKGGHGFGLHSCANYMREMGGEIRAESDGEGKGAAFVLTFTNCKGMDSSNGSAPHETGSAASA